MYKLVCYKMWWSHPKPFSNFIDAYSMYNLQSLLLDRNDLIIEDWSNGKREIVWDKEIEERSENYQKEVDISKIECYNKFKH